MFKLQIKSAGKIQFNELHATRADAEKSIANFKKEECFADYKFKITDAKPKFVSGEKNRDLKNERRSARILNAITVNI